MPEKLQEVTSQSCEVPSSSHFFGLRATNLGHLWPYQHPTRLHHSRLRILVNRHCWRSLRLQGNCWQSATTILDHCTTAKPLTSRRNNILGGRSLTKPMGTLLPEPESHRYTTGEDGSVRPVYGYRVCDYVLTMNCSSLRPGPGPAQGLDLSWRSSQGHAEFPEACVCHLVWSTNYSVLNQPKTVITPQIIWKLSRLQIEIKLATHHFSINRHSGEAILKIWR